MLKRAPLHAFSNFHLNCILFLMMKMNKKQFLFHSWKIGAEGRNPLSQLRLYGSQLLSFEENRAVEWTGYLVKDV